MSSIFISKLLLSFRVEVVFMFWDAMTVFASEFYIVHSSGHTLRFSRAARNGPRIELFGIRNYRSELLSCAHKLELY